MGKRHLSEYESNDAPLYCWFIILVVASWLFLQSRTQFNKKPFRIGLAVAAILLYFFLAVSSLVDDSPTMDEQNHIARGIAFLRTGDPRLSLEHPPLINVLSALPLLTLPELQLPTDHPSWERREGWYEFADLFLWQYNHDTDRIIFLSRLPIVFLSIGLALVGFHFARQLWGVAAALPALVLLLFEPNLIAHGRYSTTDMGAALFTLLATFALWRMWQEPECLFSRRWGVAALCMGLAFGSKLSTLGFVFIWAVMALLPLYGTANGARLRASLRRLAQLATAGLASLLVIWLIFGFQWGAPNFMSATLQSFNDLSLPMPTFWAGIEQAMILGGGGRSTAFLFGRFSEVGWWYYFPAAFAVKTPLIILVLLSLATILLLHHAATRKKATFLLIGALGFYLFAMQSSLNIGYRHVLPVLPFLIILVSGLASSLLNGLTTNSLPKKVLIFGSALLICLSLWIHPNYLSYFNAAAGGSANGYRVLTDSNVDWGQDLLRLRSWMVDHDVASVKLGWFGSADPDYYEIPYEPLPGLGRDRFFRLWWDVPFDPVSPEPGIYAISASSLWEPPLRIEEKLVYAWFRAREPDARIGYSILIYDVR